jgi:hypothetical protein
VEGLLESFGKLTFYEGCVCDKQPKKLFPTKGASKANKLLALVHYDIWGPGYYLLEEPSTL